MADVSFPIGRIKNEIASLVWRSPLAPVVDSFRSNKELRQWVQGRAGGAAPALVKRALIRSLAAGYRLSAFVETGTCLGSTTYALRNDFSKIITIELDRRLWENARLRLRKFPHISVRQGDSGTLLPEIVKELDQPALFFLDGHYSGGVTARGSKDTPILEELNCIFGDGRLEHAIVIDDARLFDGSNDYPTMDALRDFVRARAPRLGFFQHTDMIVLGASGPATQMGLAAK